MCPEAGRRGGVDEMSKYVCVCVCDVERQTPPIFKCNMFDQSIYITAVFQNRTFELFACHAAGELFICVVC
jgi:hypothetical protein